VPPDAKDARNAADRRSRQVVIARVRHRRTRKGEGLLDLLETSLSAAGSAAEDAVLDSLYRLEPASPGFEGATEARDLCSEFRENVSAIRPADRFEPVGRYAR
jgi:hypothetical protein